MPDLPKYEDEQDDMDAMFGGFKGSPSNNKRGLINEPSTPLMDKLQIYGNKNSNGGVKDSLDWGDDF